MSSPEPTTMSARPARLRKQVHNSSKGWEVVRQFMWEITSIHVYLNEIRQFQAKALGITGPQWTILMALAEPDGEKGIPVNVVSKLMHVDSSFITTQSKLLEKRGFLLRKSSTSDARVVELSLTDKATMYLASIAARQDALDEFILGEFHMSELTEFTRGLVKFKRRLARARLKVALDF